LAYRLFFILKIGNLYAVFAEGRAADPARNCGEEVMPTAASSILAGTSLPIKVQKNRNDTLPFWMRMRKRDRMVWDETAFVMGAGSARP